MPRLRSRLGALLFGVCASAVGVPTTCLPAARAAAPATTAAVLVATAAPPTTTAAAPWATAPPPSATLSASFKPERLGRRTTLGFGFQISAGADRVPPALTAVSLNYPQDLGIALSRLGLATCAETTLQTSGPRGCPADAIMGHGTALAEIALGPQVVQEGAPIAIVRASDREGHIALLFDAIGSTPLADSIVFPGTLLPATAPFGGAISIEVPLIPSVPGAPDVALVQLRSTLGPSRVVYYERVGARTLAYQPAGILLPDSCPAGGFPFAAEFSFVDGSRASATTVVPCPGRQLRRASASTVGR